MGAPLRSETLTRKPRGFCTDPVRVMIVDERCGTRRHTYAPALHRRSLHLLDELGLASELLEKGRRIDRISFFDGRADNGTFASL